MKILFITGGSVGDAVISTSLIAHLSDTYPQAKFTIVAGPASTPLFEACPALERLITVKKQRHHKHWWMLWRSLRKERFDIAVDLRGSMLSYFLHVKQRKIFHMMDKSQSKYDQLASLFGLKTALATRLWASAEATQKATALLPAGPVIVLAPKSNAAFKDWPVERFAELGKWLLSQFTGATIVVLGLAQQKAAIAPLVQALPPAQVLDLCGATDIPTALAVLKKAKLVVSVDSGLMHMAAALGTPVVGLYGPTNDKRYAPRGSHVRVVKVREFRMDEEEIKESTLIEELRVELVKAAVQELLGN